MSPWQLLPLNEIYGYPTFKVPWTHWGWDKMNTILQTTFSNAFLWLNIIEFSLNFVPKGLNLHKLSLVHVMAWSLTGDKPLPEPVIPQLNNTYMPPSLIELKKRKRPQEIIRTMNWVHNSWYVMYSVGCNFDGLVQNCSNSSALTMELLQSCTKPSFFILW